MDATREIRPNRYGMTSVCIVLLLAGGLGYRAFKSRTDVESVANFSIHIPSPTVGWKDMPHGPQAYFLYGQPQKHLLIRGAVNQMIDDVNPTPELNRDNLAQLIVDNTHDNMPGWSAVVEDKVDAQGTSFRIVRRSEKNHVVVTAFAVRGNTTFLVSLSGRDGSAAEVDKGMNDFRQFISQISFTKTDMSKW